MVDPADFTAAIRQGTRAGDPLVVVHVRADEERNSRLVSFVVPKREIKRANGRNRVKRQLRHLMRERIAELPEGSRVVVRASRNALGVPSQGTRRTPRPRDGASVAQVGRAMNLVGRAPTRPRVRTHRRLPALHLPGPRPPVSIRTQLLHLRSPGHSRPRSHQGTHPRNLEVGAMQPVEPRGSGSRTRAWTLEARPLDSTRRLGWTR